MAFNSNPPKAEYQATAGQTNFPFLFKIYFTSDIKVYHTPSTGETVLLTEGIGYSVVINGDDGGTVTLILVVENNDYIVLERELELTRYVEYQTSGDLLAGTLNADQDYQTYLTSDQNAIKDNSLRLAQGTFGVDTEIPFPVASQYLRWNSSASKIEYAPSSSISIDWGNISGTLSDQTDLQNALNAKLNTNNPVYTGVMNGDSISVTLVNSNAINLAGNPVATVSYVDSENQAQDIVISDNTTAIANKLPIDSPTFTNFMSGPYFQADSFYRIGDYDMSLAGSDFRISSNDTLTNYLNITPDAETLSLSNNSITYDNVPVITGNASETNVGGVKVLILGTDCYITTDGSTPGP